MEIQDYPNYLIYNDGLVFSEKRNIIMKTRITKGTNENKDGIKELIKYQFHLHIYLCM